MYSRIAGIAALVLTATAAAAQEKQSVRAIVVHDKMAAEALAQLAPARVPLESRIVKDAPYMAEVITEHTQVLPDGNRIVQRTTGRVYRDSQGRMRREDDGNSGEPLRIAITDPIAGTSYSLDPKTRNAWKTPTEVARAVIATMKERTQADPGEVARKRAVEEQIAVTRKREVEMQHATTAPKVAGGHVSAEALPAMRHDAGEVKTENLPARSIDGITVEGTRMTRTVPAGAIGNERPIVTITETWRSPELQVLVMTRTSDPRTGESTYRLQNIVRGEQSRSWFEVPSDYTIRETGIRRQPEVK